MTAVAEYLDKLWETLFSRGTESLVAPRDIRRRHLDRREVRAGELRETARVLRELQGLLEGRLRINDRGELVAAADPAEFEGIRTSSLIEKQQDEGPVYVVPDTPELLEQVSRQEALRIAQREMILRHVAIMAEEEGARLPADRLRPEPVDADWLVRWREGAGTAVAIELRRLWARMLAGEVLRPGTYSVRTLEFLRALSRVDREMIRLCSGFCFDGFIYRSPGRYFSDQLHRPMFEVLEELGLVRGVYGRAETWLLTSATRDRFRVILPCHQRAIFVEGEQAEDDIRFPVYRLTRFGRELFSLFPGHADTAYLAAVATEFKKRGFHVELGDWSMQGGQGLFTERVAL